MRRSDISAAKYVILLGAPGAGKGTQAEMLRERLSLAHVASGDLFRENIANRTPLGTLAKTFMDRGDLVPDDITLKMVMERIQQPDSAHGVVFDGFPRTEQQAQALDAALRSEGKNIAAVLLLDVRDESLIERLTARRVCPKDGTVYNLLTNPPKISGRCDKDGSELEQREDDKPETVRRRLQVYQTQTHPLVEYYRRLGLLKTINGEREIEIVQVELVRAVESM